MRILPAAAACAMTLSIAGCGLAGGDDNSFRTSFRENGVQSCVAASRASPNSSQFDWARLCGCAMDRYIAGKSASDLRSADPQDPALRAATQQCAMEQMSSTLNAIANGQEENSAAPSN